jgi:DNA-binding CsgD family transcriptional regulator
MKKHWQCLKQDFKYCEDHDIDFLGYYMLSCKAQLLCETGRWEKAESIATQLLKNQHHLLVKMGSLVTMARLMMRRGKFEEAENFLQEAKAIAMPTHEAQRIIPVLTSALELSWIRGSSVVPLDEIRDAENTLFSNKNNSWHYSSLAYWMGKHGIEFNAQSIEFNGPYMLEHLGRWKDAAEAWRKMGCPYEQALALFEGEEMHQREGLMLLDALGATATRDMLKSKLKLKGMKNIPRGPRESTRNNPAQLTLRQIEILLLLKEGKTYKEIADKLFISLKTVEHHISAILLKLEVNSRAKAVLEAEKLGILK